MVIVYTGDIWDGSTCKMRMDALVRLGHSIHAVDTTYTPRGISGAAARVIRKMGCRLDVIGARKALLAACLEHAPDVVWIDKGLGIDAATLTKIQRLLPGTSLVHYSPDDMGGKHNQSAWYLESIPFYNLHVTTKSFNVAELYALGARAVLFVNNAFCPHTHRPVLVDPSLRRKIGGPIGFIGGFEAERAEAVYQLAAKGFQIGVWGGGWNKWARRHRHPTLRVGGCDLWGDHYTQAICSFDINLGFLRRLNRDLQTTRSVEIPACGAFLLAERTSEHLEMFVEGREAEFFNTPGELLEKCRYYLSHAPKRLEIAAAGRDRCIRSSYSYDAQVNQVLQHLRRGAQPGNQRLGDSSTPQFTLQSHQ